MRPRLFSRLVWPALPVLAVLGIAAGGRASAWEQHTPLPDPRSEVAAATVGGDIVVVGGFIADGNNSSRVDAYSVADDRWRRLPDLPSPSTTPLPRARVDASTWRAATAPTGSRCVRASCSTAGPGAGFRSCPTAAPPQRRRSPMAACTSSAGATAAGCSRRTRSSSSSARRAGCGSTAPRRASTSRRPPRGTGSIAIGGRAAGLDSNTTAFETYDADARRWRALAPLPGARGGTGAAAIGGRIVSVGGEEPGGTIKTVFAYDVRARRWAQLADLPTPRHGLGVVAADDRVWAVAGGTVPGLTVSGAIESLKP